MYSLRPLRLNSLFNMRLYIYLAFIFLIRGCKLHTDNTSVGVAKKNCVACKAPSRFTSVASVVNVENNNELTKDEMVLIPGGTFQMGSNDFPDAKPVHTVTVDGFYMDQHE